MSLLIHEIDGRRPKTTLSQRARRARDRAGWTEDREARLRQLWGDGLSASLIADDLGGVTRNAVIGKIHRFGLFRGPTGPRLTKPRLPPIKGRRRMGPVYFRPKPLQIVRIPMVAMPDLPSNKSDCAVSLLDRQIGQCSWPLWDDKTPASERMYCGAPVMPEKCWCPRHFKVGTMRPRKTGGP